MNDSLDELRSLLVSPEQEELQRVAERLRLLESRKTDVSAEELAEMLPAAIATRSRRDKKLAAALEPTVEETLRGSVKRNPKPIVEAIFPIIGPAIRRAISEALSSTLESVNRTMEHQFSLQGIRWRMEAYRTGRSFSEVVLANTLLYAVEQIYVVHNETGLPLVHVSTDPLAVSDGALVSGMLSVVQDFVRDSLGGESSDTLESVEFGDLIIWVEPGPEATLAAVIRGAPPRSMRERFQTLIETFHLEYQSELPAFSGDAAPFDIAVPEFEDALDSRYASKSGRAWKTWTAGGLIVVLLIALGVFFVGTRVKWARFVDRVDSEPGIVVTNSGRDGTGWFITGLRDPLATDIHNLVSGSGFDDAVVSIRMEPYLTSAPEIVARRARRVLQAPEDVRLEIQGGILQASGAASNTWIADARVRASQIFAVDGYSDEAVVNLDLLAAIQRIELVEAIPITFAAGSAVPENRDRLASSVRETQTILDALNALGRTGMVVVSGSASSDGERVVNQRLAVARAEVVRTQLAEAGIPAQVRDGLSTEAVDTGRRTAVIRILIR